MSSFSTNAFRFTLPGDEWAERTIHLFRRKNDPDSAFVISRSPARAEDMSIEQLVMSVPAPADTEKQILRSEVRYFGSADAEDVSILARQGTKALYHRIVCVPYYGQVLSFQWSGPFPARADIDARVERTLHSLRFWER
ncbi:MAG: DcrB-related protein [Polyangiaceae bacterium]|nr:DcrB-related protein [Polyangiaceae bacterium]